PEHPPERLERLGPRSRPQARRESRLRYAAGGGIDPTVAAHHAGADRFGKLEKTAAARAVMSGINHGGMRRLDSGFSRRGGSGVHEPGLSKKNNLRGIDQPLFQYSADLYVGLSHRLDWTVIPPASGL